MPVKTIPKNKNWTLSYLGNSLGEINESFNIDFTKDFGNLSLSSKVYPHTTGLDYVPTQFSYNNASGAYLCWTVTDVVYNVSNYTTTAFVADALANSPTGLSDADLNVFYRNSNGYDVMLVSKATDIAKLEKTTGTATWNNTWFSTLYGASALTTGYAHPMAIFQRILVVGDNNSVHLVLWDGSNHPTQNIESSTNTAPISVKITGHGYTTGDVVTIAGHVTNTAANGTWTITKTDNNNFTLDNSTGIGIGGATGTALQSSFTVIMNEISFNSDYYVRWIQCTKDKIFIGLTNKNDYVSSIVVEYDYFSKLQRALEVKNGWTTGFIMDNNCHIIDQKGNLCSYTGSYFQSYASFPSVYQEGITLNKIHRNGIMIFEGRPHIMVGDSFSSNTNTLAGIWCYEPEGNRLYRRFCSSFSTSTLLDYFTTGIETPGALWHPLGSSYFMGGVGIRKTNENTALQVIINNERSGITVASDIRGWFTTSRISSANIEDVWRNVLIKYNSNPMGQPVTGKITLKYRTDYPNYTSVTRYNSYGRTDKVEGTWTSSTKFTTTVAINYPSAGVAVGDEVFITNGDGAGGSAHIKGIIGTTTKTIELDEAIVASPSGTFTYFITNFKKLAPTITDATRGYQIIDLPTGAIGKELQLKVELQGGFQVEEIQIGSQPNLVLEK